MGRTMQKTYQVNLGLMISPAGSEKPYLPSAIRVPCHGKGTLTYLASHLHLPHIPSVSSNPPLCLCQAYAEAVKLKVFSCKLTSVQIQAQYSSNLTLIDS